MADVSAGMVKDLREKTGAGMMDCKKALTEASGDLEAAVDWLRKKGLAAAAKKAGRAATEGVVGHYIHPGAKVGVIVEVNCETDFVARTDDFLELVKDIAMHIAAADPKFVGREEVTPEVLERERAIFSEQALASGKPPAVVEKIVTGKLDKWFGEICLLEQPWVKEPKRTIDELRTEIVQKTGENVQVRRFVRWGLGEGIEKKKENLAEEIAKMTEAIK